MFLIIGLSMSTKDKKKTLSVKYSWENISDFKTMKASIENDLNVAGKMIPYEGEIKAKFEKLYTLYILESSVASTINKPTVLLKIGVCWACKCNHCGCYHFTGCGLVPPSCGVEWCYCCNDYWGTQPYVGTCIHCGIY